MKEKQRAKTVYLYSETETAKDGAVREKKILALAKKEKLTQSGAVRKMIDAYQE